MDTETKTYTLGGRTFTYAPLVAGQERWLYQAGLRQGLRQGLSGDALMDLLYGHATELCAVVLLEEGQTQEAKVRAGWEGVTKLELWLSSTVRLTDLAPVLRDFFNSGQLPSMTSLVAATLAPANGSTADPISTASTP